MFGLLSAGPCLVQLRWQVLRLFCTAAGAVFLLAFGAAAQTLSADDYFRQARTVAFEQKNYPAAIQLCRQGLQQSPDYLDIEVFLGRLYYWNKQTDSSLQVLQAVLQKRPDYEDASLALADISYFEKDYARALALSVQGLRHHPGSRPLALRKARSLAALSRNREAYVLADSLLQTAPGNEQLRALVSQLVGYSFRNKIGLAYDYTYFDKQFSNDWHLSQVDYSRQTQAGPVTGRFSYANRYAQSGWQLEADAYPRLSRMLYAYASIGYASGMPVLPKLRAGFSLYASLPRAFEAEGGWRYLNFNNDTWVYTASLGKYYKNFWFNARTYLSPTNESISQSYLFTTRYYLKGADDYLSLILGRGVSPDEGMQAIRLNSGYRLRTFRLGAGYRFSLASRHLGNLAAALETGEYLPQTKGSLLNLSAGYQFRF